MVWLWFETVGSNYVPTIPPFCFQTYLKAVCNTPLFLVVKSQTYFNTLVHQQGQRKCLKCSFEVGHPKEESSRWDFFFLVMCSFCVWLFGLFHWAGLRFRAEVCSWGKRGSKRALAAAGGHRVLLSAHFGLGKSNPKASGIQLETTILSILKICFEHLQDRSNKIQRKTQQRITLATTTTTTKTLWNLPKEQQTKLSWFSP